MARRLERVWSRYPPEIQHEQQCDHPVARLRLKVPMLKAEKVDNLLHKFFTCIPS